MIRKFKCCATCRESDHPEAIRCRTSDGQGVNDDDAAVVPPLYEGCECALEGKYGTIEKVTEAGNVFGQISVNHEQLGRFMKTKLSRSEGMGFDE